MHRNIEHAAVPHGRTVVPFQFPDAPPNSRTWWPVVTAAEADVCDANPGYPVAVMVSADLRRMVEIWRGEMRWSAAPSVR